MMYPDITAAVLTPSVMNPLGNDLWRGHWCAMDNYVVDLTAHSAPCGCVEMANDLRSSPDNATEGKRIYLYPDQVKFFTDKGVWRMDLLDMAIAGGCTGRCTPKSHSMILMDEIQRIVKDTEYISPMLRRK